MKSWILSLVLILTPSTFGQENSSEPDYRFLFVIDNSFSMRSKKEAVVKTVRDLIATGFHNQAEEGERFGIWTFNDQVQTKKFPTQVWHRSEAQALSAIAAQFLDSQKPEGKSDLLLALLEMDKYASDDRDMLVFLFCEGDEGVVGTPFDSEINRIFMDYHRILQRSRKPFLLTFAYHRGLMTSARVFYGNGVVELPELVRRQEKRIHQFVQAVPLPAAGAETNVQTAVAVAIVPAEIPPPAEPISPRTEQKPQQDMREVASPQESRFTPRETKPEAEPPTPTPPTSKPAPQETREAVKDPQTLAAQESKPALQQRAPVPEAKPAPQKPAATIPTPKPREPLVAAVQPKPEEIRPTQPPAIQPAPAAPAQPPATLAKAEPPKPVSANPSPAAVKVEPLEPVESTAFKPSNSTAFTATPGMITPAERSIAYWPFITAALALLALVGYWIWNKRKARPSSSFISQGIER